MMHALIASLMTFPVMVFAVLSAVALLYWALVALRLVKGEALDHTSLKEWHLSSEIRAMGLGGIPAALALSLVSLLGLMISFAIEIGVLRWFSLGMLSIIVGLVMLWFTTVVAIQLARPLAQALHPLALRLGASRCLLGERVEVLDEVARDEYEVRLVDRPEGEILRVRSRPPVRFARGERLVLSKWLAGPDGVRYRAVREASFSERRQGQQRPHGHGGGRMA